MRGFMAVLEVFLAIVLVYIVMGQIQINLPAKYSDTTNMDRLHRYSHDIAFSLCGSLKAKRGILNDSFTFDLGNVLPQDVAYRIYYYTNDSNDHLLDSHIKYVDGGRVELFYDEFYNLDAWTGNISSAYTWNISSTYGGYNASAVPDTAAWHQVDSDATPHYITHAQSTEGYTDINVSFWFRTSFLIDSFSSDYYNGTDWTSIAGGIQTSWMQPPIDYLPGAASDNPNFAIRFKCYESTVSSTEYCNVDTLRITGIPKDVPKATSSCIIAGGPVKSNYSAYACDYKGSDCLSPINITDSNWLPIVENENFTVSFNPSQNGSIVEFNFDARNNETNQTTLFYDSAGNQIASYNMTDSWSYSKFSLDLTDYFPDPNGSYNLTIKPTVNATFDLIRLNVSSNVYSPAKVVVQTWNYGD